MTEQETTLGRTVAWLGAHAGFPATRLPARAELLVCLAALAEAEAAPGGPKGSQIVRHQPGQVAALRTHALRRSQVHFKCDNSAKV
ncbi:hypothetical protein K0B96_14445 [Horticoccus luteus]|uniref:Uncharacterized protein n=1 Tax=Horticoccus luteus TaxID=2862869 RepID=A0A8F9TUR4_9BACT|nr:hypothetical protein [Horticoccus luteus]QYM78485.1 hypothetical protein K0B96_14445 [Horticoccus luteus]